MRAEGPCLKHCYCSYPVAALAYVALIYLMSCVSYLIMVKYRKIGTPFTDSLTSAQLSLKQCSANTRMRIFRDSVILSIITLVITKPLRYL
jgi:hypothetical protein